MQIKYYFLKKKTAAEKSHLNTLLAIMAIMTLRIKTLFRKNTKISEKISSLINQKF